MKKHVTLKELRVIVRRLVEAELDDDLNTVEVGDVVDVHMDEVGTLPVRVIELVDDVNAEAGAADPRNPSDFTGPGFVGEIDPESGESGTLVFSMNQVVPGSKAKGYFPMGDSDWEQDDRDDVPPDLYRKAATRFVTKANEPEGSYASGLPDDMSDRYRSH